MSILAASALLLLALWAVQVLGVAVAQIESARDEDHSHRVK